MTAHTVPEVARRRPGRPATESPSQRLARLEHEIAAARAAVREADQRKFVVLGEAVAAEAEASPELKARLVDILRRRVTSASARADIASMLV